LEEGAFKPTEQCKADGAKKLQFATFNRSIGRAKPVPYHITDKAPAAGHPDWKRVVAVFVQGVNWQFKDWPFKARAPSPPPPPAQKNGGRFSA
jgi:RNA pol II accessory factor, Cdc73 family, C-terminal